MQSAAIKALGQLQAGEAIPKLIELLNNKDYLVQSDTIEALGQLHAGEAIPKLIELLNNKDDFVQSVAIKALGTLLAKETIPKLIELLNDENEAVQIAAIQALSQLQAKKATPKLIELLANENKDVQSTAIKALGELQVKEATPKLIELLANENEITQSAAIEALGKLQAKEAIPNLIRLLASQNEMSRRSAIEVLGSLQAKGVISKLIKLLDNNDIYVQCAAIETLGLLRAKEAIPKILKLLVNDIDHNYPIPVGGAIQNIAIIALGRLQAKEAIPKLIELLNTPAFSLERIGDSPEESTAIIALGELQLEEKKFIPSSAILMAIRSRLYDEQRQGRFFAHLLAGSRFQTLVWCLGNHNKQDCSKQTFQKDHVKTIETLKLFKEFYQATPKDEFEIKLHDDLVIKINMVAEALVEQQTELTFAKLRHELTANQDLSSKLKVLADIFAAKEEVTLLDDISKLIAKDGYDTKDLERKKADIFAKQQWLQSVIATSSIISLHLGFWLVLIFLYPRSPMIQAIFFWNPWIRRIIGLGYIGFCLTWIPFLRRRLLSPFQESLLADANLATFQTQLYFADMSITLKGINQPQPLLETLAQTKGQIILEGESGLGKTMYLRYLAQHSTRPFAFLHATRCTAGVIPALKEKLHGFAQNETFLTSIIYAGGVDLCIDGLNEVSPDTRAKITQFVEQHFKGSILLSTQPLEWQPPQTAKTYRLLPLNQQQIETFLLSRPEQPENYAQTCTDYLNAALSAQLDKALQELHLKTLSNPMDLTVVAHLLAQGIQPNLSNLIAQQYQTMNEDYQSKSFNQNFPLNKFAQHVFEIRLQDKRVLNHADFMKELDCLEEHKLVIKRTEQEGDKEQENFYFRHDKIWDFFNAHVFKQHDNEWLKTYFADERFRGAFLVLAWSLPLPEAQSLLDKLQHYIVQSNDNILHHQYYQLVDLRKRLQTAA